MEKVTVCIPTYKRASTIQRAVQSILEQTYSNIDIIICDNSSGDNTEEAVGLFKDDRVHYICFHEYMDVNYNFIRALKLAKTEYICLFHSDDWYYPTIIEEQLKFLKENNVGAVFSKMNACGEESLMTQIRQGDNDIEFEEYDYTNYLKLALSIQGPGMNCPTFMTKRSVLEDTGIFNCDRAMISDMSFWLRISRKYNLVKLNKYLMNYYLSREQLSQKIFNGGHVVVSPSYILLDQELKSLDHNTKMKVSKELKKYRLHRLKELIHVNRLRKSSNLEPYSFSKFVIKNEPFSLDNVAINEKDYLDYLYKRK